MVLPLTACGTEANVLHQMLHKQRLQLIRHLLSCASTKKIAMIVKVIGNQYWAVLQAGAEQAGKDLGCEVITGVGAEPILKTNTLLQNAVSAK